ncbi:MAG: outer membrane protein assembly factor BamA [Gammaproteobacteria bacterium]|nr:outer membrane protein assembly factor BamA [Gammaproteobacteria bacterium]
MLLGSCVSRVLAFPVEDIRVDGLRRVPAGAVFAALPVGVGDEADERVLKQIVISLFKTGSFDDVQVGRDGNVLVILVQERPAIESIEIDGNKAIKTEALMEGLSKSGLAEGEIFEKVTLEHIRADLERQYVSQGRYGARIESTVEKLPRNKVAIKIDVTEGEVARITHINIVGNRVYSDEILKEELELGIPGFLAVFSDADKYSKEKLSGDIEKIESYYLDSGYLNFDVESTQVSISPDKQDVYITINLHEGEPFEVEDVELAGELHDVPPESLKALLLVRKGQMFSRDRITKTEERLEAVLGNSGYTFASVTGQPMEVEGEPNKVKVKFFVDAGKRAYVRRINFRGNTLTHDEVLRREMRQMESGWASTAAIEQSKVRLERLGFFKEVNVETPSVPGTDDQIDVDYSVVEAPSGQISATLGYSESYHFMMGLNYQESNVFGSGNSVNLGVNKSSYQKSYNFSYFNPYYTVDGVSRGFSFFYRESDYGGLNVSSFNSDAHGVSINYGYPISEISRIGFSLGYEDTRLKAPIYAAWEILDFLEQDGTDFEIMTLSFTYQMSALNSGFLPTRGKSQRLNIEASIPGSEMEYYRINYTGQVFFPMGDSFALRLKTELGWGNAYGSNSTYPFYKHFYSGGFGSIRGYESNSLGPKATPSPYYPSIYTNKPDPIGGNLLVEATAEILFPLPFVEDQSQMKSVFFYDIGNVFNTDCPDFSIECQTYDRGELRSSVGIAFTVITGLAPISMSLSVPLNEKEGDRTKSFQFELGRTF